MIKIVVVVILVQLELLSLLESVNVVVVCVVVIVVVMDGMGGCGAVQIAACIVHVFIEGIELTYIDDLSVAFLILCKLEIQGVLIVRIWQ